MEKQRNILIIEDIASTVAGIRAALVFYGYSVDMAYSISSARSMLSKYRYDVILIDWLIPEEEGGDIIEGGEIILQEIEKGDINIVNKKTKYIIYSNHINVRSLLDYISNRQNILAFEKISPPEDVISEIEKMLEND